MNSTAGATARPKVSVLMTVFNAEPFLARSIDSLVAQTFQDWELVVVENGSSDGSKATLGKYPDARIRPFLFGENIGRTPALRYAFEQARGEYIAVLDADDIAYPERLAKQVAYLDAHADVVVLGAWADYIDEDDRITGTFAPDPEPAALIEYFGRANPIMHSASMYRADIARAAGGYPLDAPHSQDYALWLNMLRRGMPALLPECLCRYRILAQSMTRSGKYRVDEARDKLILLTAAGKQFRLQGRGRRLNREEVAIARFRYAVALMRSGRIGDGIVASWHSIVRDPMCLINNRITRGLFSAVR